MGKIAYVFITVGVCWEDSKYKWGSIVFLSEVHAYWYWRFCLRGIVYWFRSLKFIMLSIQVYMYLIRRISGHFQYREVSSAISEEEVWRFGLLCKVNFHTILLMNANFGAFIFVIHQKKKRKKKATKLKLPNILWYSISEYQTIYRIRGNPQINNKRYLTWIYNKLKTVREIALKPPPLLLAAELWLSEKILGRNRELQMHLL